MTTAHQKHPSLYAVHYPSPADTSNARNEADLADFLPLVPTPFTRSLFVAAWARARRTLNQALGLALPAGAWQLDREDAPRDVDFWVSLADRVHLPATFLGLALGLPLPSSGTERGGFGAALRSWRWARERAAFWQRARAEVLQACSTAHTWYLRVRTITWGQAELLQVMEEIEAQVGALLVAYTLATLALADALSRVPDLSPDALQVHLGGRCDLASLTFLQDQQALVRTLARDEEARAWLMYTGGTESLGTMPDGDGRTALTRFLHTYPWLSTQPYEVASPRWVDRPYPFLNALTRVLTCPVSARFPEPGTPLTDTWWEVWEWVQAREEIRQGLGWALAATRIWADAAAEEAMADGRLTTRTDAFLLHLEEMKQLMTGEWSDPGPVQQLVVQRAEEQSVRMEGGPPQVEKLAGDVLVPGLITGPITWVTDAEQVPIPIAGKVLGTPGMHPGWAFGLLWSEGLVTTAGDLFSCSAVIARALAIPARVLPL